MRRRSSLPLVAGSALFGLLGIWFTIPSPFHSSGPLARVDDAERRVISTGERKVHVEFTIRNDGGADLDLGEARTTCGCSVASLSSARIAPGRTATLAIEGRPPESGERLVKITVPTNAKDSPLTLSLTMVGHRPPPFVVTTSGPLHLGVITPTTGEEFVLVKTQEPKGPPWIAEVVSNEQNLTIQGGLVAEHESGPDTVYREYRFSVRLKSVPPIGGFVCELLFRAGNSAEVARISLDGVVHPPIYASPAKLFASLGPEDPAPRFHVRFRASDGTASLTLQPSQETVRDFSVSRVKSTPDVLAYEIMPKARPSKSESTKIMFNTNDARIPEIEIPITYRVTDLPPPSTVGGL